MSKSEKWFVYIIQNENGLLYTGITTDLERRLNEHQTGKKGAKFFNLGAPKKLLYVEEWENRSEASKREYQIKQMKRAQKIALVNTPKN